MPRSQNPLNNLLRQAKREAFLKGKVQVTLVQAKPSPPPTETLWKVTRVVSLIHVSQNGHRTYLGAFTEHQNDRLHARRLLPLHGTPPKGLPQEIVTGDFWLAPKETPIFVDTEQEIQAIRKRFFELMEDWK